MTSSRDTFPVRIPPRPRAEWDDRVEKALSVLTRPGGAERDPNTPRPPSNIIDTFAHHPDLIRGWMTFNIARLEALRGGSAAGDRRDDPRSLRLRRDVGGAGSRAELPGADGPGLHRRRLRHARHGDEHELGDEGWTVGVVARYHDTFRRTDAGWRIWRRHEEFFGWQPPTA
jgi:hypothetical protein